MLMCPSTWFFSRASLGLWEGVLLFHPGIEVKRCPTGVADKVRIAAEQLPRLEYVLRSPACPGAQSRKGCENVKALENLQFIMETVRG